MSTSEEEDAKLITRSEGRREVAEKSGEPPVVARLVVEIRSDGSTTIARGALHDGISGEQVAVEARGGSPLALAIQLASSLFKIPAIANQVRTKLLTGRRRRGTTRDDL